MAARAEVSLWSDQAFCGRVARRARELGLSVPEACLKAGLAGDYLSKPAVKGRNVGSILQLAEALDIDAAVLMGLRPAYQFDPGHAVFIANMTAHLAVGLAQRPLDLDVIELTQRLLVLIRNPPINGNGNGKMGKPKPAKSQSPK